MIKRIKTNIASMLMAVAMLAGVASVPAPVAAADYAVPTDKATLSVDYLGISDENGAPNSTVSTQLISSDDIGKIIWVGVAVTDSYKLGGYFTEHGIYNMEIAFDYNPAHLVPCGLDKTTDDKTKWLNAISAHNLLTDADALNSMYWDANKYEFVSDACAISADTNTDPHRETAPLTDHKMLFVSIRAKDGATHNRFEGSTADDASEKKYLIRLPFKVVGTPDNGVNDSSLKLALGPQTFVLGSGENGYENYAAWEKEDKTEAIVNLKNYFNFTGDPTLFGGSKPITATLTNIEMFEYIAPSADPDSGTATPREYELYRSFDLATGAVSDEGFVSNVIEYWASVDHDVSNVMLKIYPNIEMTVSFNGDAVTPLTSVAGSGYIDTGQIGKVTPLTPTSVSTDGGFTNTITVTAGGSTYTIYVRRYLQPKIELNYGNSPVALIRRDTAKFPTTVDQDTAIAAFKNSHQYYKTFVGQVPEGGTTLPYTAVAWRDYNPDADLSDSNYMNDENYVNYDYDESALFVYHGKVFKDPGLTVYDELGKVVENPTVTRTLKIKQQASDGVSKYTGTDTADGVTEIDAPLVSGTTDTYTLYRLRVRTDVYKMEYSISYTAADGSTQTLTGSRPIIILGRRGDIFLSQSPAVNDNDANNLKLFTVGIHTGNSLVAYRNADFNTSGGYAINDNDANYLKLSTVGVHTSTDQYYPDLNPELNQ